MGAVAETVEQVPAKAQKRLATIRFDPWMADELLEIFIEMHEDSPVMKRFTLSEDSLKATIITAIEHPDEIAGFACVDFEKQKILGLMVCTTGRAFYSEDTIANDVALYVLPEFRDGPAQEMLLTAYLAWAKRLKLKAFFFSHMQGTHGDLSALLNKLGWEKIGEQFVEGARGS